MMKVYLLSLWSNIPIVDIEYQQGIFSPIFVVEEFYVLLVSVLFLIKFNICINNV